MKKIDNVLVDYLCPFLKKMNFRSNGMSTLSLFFGLLSIYYLYYGKFIALV